MPAPLSGPSPPPGRCGPGSGWPCRRLLCGTGFLSLAAALALLVSAEGWGMALPLWLGLLSVAAAVLALALSYAPRAVPALTGGVLLLGIVCALA
ncbi:iron uptake protein [Pseudoroseomonas rhizosphaerae]|uniref:Iron uptake protein n=1 Tax=Teichococcus rhizosphaerae TaxID=1335062 RepID=A0A2C7A660_9PROT|nr:DUF3325 family protein [Pseudoroseomonas rhizosphaerae]PHK93479.1 iron uptake protein [Pseudoroseomonas rhizosphaerae]